MTKCVIWLVKNDWWQKKEDKTRFKMTFPNTHRTKRSARTKKKTHLSLLEQNHNQTASHSDFHDDCLPPRGCVTKESELVKGLKYKKKWLLKLYSRNNHTTSPSCCKLTARYHRHIRIWRCCVYTSSNNVTPPPKHDETPSQSADKELELDSPGLLRM